MPTSPLRRGIAALAAVLLVSPTSIHAQPAAAPAGEAPAAAAPGSAAADPAPATGPGQLHLVLFLGGKETPLANVKVTIGTQEQVTNESGAARFTVPAGAQEIRLEIPAGLLAEAPDPTLPTLVTIPAATVVAGETTEVIATIDPKGALKEALVEAPGEGEKKPTQAESFEQRKQAGPPGTIKGTVASLEGGKPVAGARVFVRGAPVEAVTNAQGAFTLTLPAGEYALSVIHPEYSTQTVEGVVVEGEKTLERKIELSPSAVELEEFVVVAPHLEGTVASVLDERRETAEVAEVLGAEQMSKAGDSDAAGALKRVTGITIIGGKYVYVRGLGERYSSTLLNGADLPSPDPTRRVIPLDLFPTGVLGAVVVQKTYSPDMPGDFAGGVVQLRTRGVPEKFTFNLGVSTGANSMTTLREGLGYEGGKYDLLGFDDGSRAIPKAVLQQTENGRKQISDLPRATRRDFIKNFKHSYEANTRTLPPDLSVNLSLGDRLSLGDVKLGYSVGGQYDNGYAFRREDRAQIVIDSTKREFVPIEPFTIRETQQTINLSGIGSVAAQFGKHHTVEGLLLYTRKTLHATAFDSGISFGGGTAAEFRDYTLRWNEQEIFAQQLRGDHTFSTAGDLKVDWLVNFARARRDEPDTREYSYGRLAPEPGQVPDPFRYPINVPLLRSYETLDDSSYVYGLNVRKPFSVGRAFSLTAATGFQHARTDRTAGITRYRFDLDSPVSIETLRDGRDAPVDRIFAAEHLGAGGLVAFNANLPSDSYEATYRTTGVYVMGDLAWKDRFRLQGGARGEWAYIQAISSSLLSNRPPDVSTLDNFNVLPAATATIMSSESTQFRLAISRTLNRPQLRELSKVTFVDPETRLRYDGNPNLVSAAITNADLRFEWYWTKTESLSLATFLKDFDRPIELTILPGPDGGVRTFRNARGALNWGIELDFRHELDEWAVWTEGFYVGTNLALIQSQVQINEEDRATVTRTERPMQGQSPWIVNLQLGYTDPDDRLNALLAFNVFGPRIVEVGVSGIPDAFERPAPLLDFTLSYRLTDALRLKAKGQNLLNPMFRVKQGDLSQREFRRGYSASLGLQYDY